MYIMPLAERYRPDNFNDFIGQEHLVSENSVLRKAIEANNISSMILWGPPGTGKTSLANVIAKQSSKKFVSFSAVMQGVKDIKLLVEEAKESINNNAGNYILFIDEIHRFNKAQQDALLPHIEKGTIILIGATTENPSFEINSALLSRCQVYVLKPIDEENIDTFIDKVLKETERGLGIYNIEIEVLAKKYLINICDGDLRTVLNALDIAANILKDSKKNIIDEALIKEILSSKKISFDKGGEEHYNLISALHKSLRGSDAQASLYWLARMIEGGCDPLYIARRLIRFASEDIGLSEPNALVQAIACKEAVHFLGYPECNTALAQCVIYLATCPKSNSAYIAYNNAKELVKNTINEPVPLNIRNAPTKLMKDLNYGKDYKYDHDSLYAYTAQSFLPASIKEIKLYEPKTYGYEKEIKKRMDFWQKLKNLKS